ncbi:MAG: BrnT family toxin [Cellvibrionaceae bacterium]|nr:BrnT family toxin [Cellvibrionaceae bacterium]
MPVFEFDNAKSIANLEKHGIDFLAAQQLWDDADALEIKATPADEERFIIIGRAHKKH